MTVRRFVESKKSQHYSGVREKLFNFITFISALSIVIILAGMVFSLISGSMPSIKKFGFNFLFEDSWDPISERFGALPFLIGTLLTSFLALLISLPFSLSLSILLGEYFKRGHFASLIKSLTELLAGIPSVIYGFWGLFIFVPVVRHFEIQMGLPSYGVGIFSASIILGIMIIPYSASLGREVIELVPSDIKEAAYSLGSTKYEVVRKVILPYARSGIFAGIMLSLGRALGETMAVTMLIGNSNFIPKSIFDPGNTMASVIANEFTEATSQVYISSLMRIGLILFVVTTAINLAGRCIIRKLSVEV